MKTYTEFLKVAEHPDLTEDERNAWLHPRSYNSVHVERLSPSLFLWRNSSVGKFCVGTLEELSSEIATLEQRVLDTKHLEYRNAALNRGPGVNLKILSQDEIDDLLSDL